MPINKELAINVGKTIPLGSGDDQDATLCVIQGDETAFVGTVAIQGRLKDSDFPWVPRAYRKYSLDGLVADESIVSAALTDISFLIGVDCAGMELQAVITHTGGSIDLGWVFRRG